MGVAQQADAADGLSSAANRQGVRPTIKKTKHMKVKIFSVCTDENFKAIRIDDEPGNLFAMIIWSATYKSSWMKTQKSKLNMFNSPRLLSYPKQPLRIPLMQILIGKWRNLC